MNDDQRWRIVADELEIRNLIARLAHLSDDGDLDDYILCFTASARWGGGGQPLRCGHAEILEGAKARRESGVTGPDSFSRHVVSTTFVTLLGDSANARSVFHFYTGIDTEPCLRAMGVYKDEFIREADGWRLQCRMMEGAAKDLQAK